MIVWAILCKFAAKFLEHYLTVVLFLFRRKLMSRLLLLLMKNIMMNAKLFLLLLFSALGFVGFAQPSGFKEVSAMDKPIIIKAISETSKKVNTLQLDFTQVKKVSMLTELVKSEGKMYYQSPMMLRWEYTLPKQPTFVMNGSKAALIDSKGAQTAPNRAFQEVSRLIVNVMNGDELTNGKNFTVYCYANGTSYWLKLVPVNKRLKQMFSSINMMVNKSNKIASMVRIDEVSGDMTTLQFSNVVANQLINKKLFQLK